MENDKINITIVNQLSSTQAKFEVTGTRVNANALIKTDKKLAPLSYIVAHNNYQRI